MHREHRSGDLRRLLLSTVTTCAVLAWSPIAAAQDKEHSEEHSKDQAKDSDDIVVTAQRREQKLQDVGIAVSVMTADSLRDMNVQTATDLTRAVPELKMNAYSSSQVVFNIRGVSQNDYGDQQEPPVAVYQDDSYSSSINLASFPTFDLARVEVLRGPQGTLFGRNATGGAVQFISNQPTRELDGYGSVTVGSYGQIITEGAVSGPLTDNLQVRVAGTRNRARGTSAISTQASLPAAPTITGPCAAS